MPIVASDLQIRGSGASNLGGTKSASTVTNVFDDVAAVEMTDGRTEYRCVYLHNGHATLTAQNTLVFIQSNTPAAFTTFEIGVGSSVVNGSEQTVANETTAPVGVSFSAPSTQGTGLPLGNIPAGQHRAVWLKRIVTAGSSVGVTTADPVTLRFYCESTE